MQVYIVTMKKYPEMRECFRNYQDIEPSIKISYSACKDVKIVATPKVAGGPEFTVTGIRDDGPFSEVINVERISVWDSPTHI